MPKLSGDRKEAPLEPFKLSRLHIHRGVSLSGSVSCRLLWEVGIFPPVQSHLANQSTCLVLKAPKC